MQGTAEPLTTVGGKIMTIYRSAAPCDSQSLVAQFISLGLGSHSRRKAGLARIPLFYRPLDLQEPRSKSDPPPPRPSGWAKPESLNPPSSLFPLPTPLRIWTVLPLKYFSHSLHSTSLATVLGQTPLMNSTRLLFPPDAQLGPLPAVPHRAAGPE